MTQRAFAVTDIQGSTALWERLGPAFAPLLADHNRIIREAIAGHGGSVVRTEGDSFAAAFPDASSAIRFATETLLRLHRHPWPEDSGELLVRIGVHAGPADPEAGAAPWYSGGVPALAAAVSAAAHGGQALATAEAIEAAHPSPAESVVSDMGEHRLTAGSAKIRLYQVLPSALASRRFPPPRTESALLTNIPRESNAFVGREAELREVQALLPTPAGRLVTLTGPGGIGKSRLARRAALALLPKFAGGVWIADVSEARTASDVARAAAAALGIQLGGRDDAPRALAAALEFRKPLLLILDAFESAVSHASATIGTWMRSARDARFLVTSRALLHLSGERELALGSLPAPPKPQRDGTRREGTAQLAGFDAVRLFLARVAEHSPSFTLSAENASAVCEICARLEGIPLALELAAARLRDATPERIVEQLRLRIGSIEHSASGSAIRRQTLTGALDWTYSELSEWERSAFRQACAFRGGFFLEAAEAVVDLSAFDEAPLAIDAIQALRDRSLVRSWDTPFGTRFGMFAPVREFGESKAAGDRTEAVSGLPRRHARHFGAYGDSCWQKLTGPEGLEALKRLSLDEENLLAAAEWSASSGTAEDREAGGRALLAWSEVAITRGLYLEVPPACATSLKGLPAPSALRCRLYGNASRADFYLGNMASAREAAELGLAEAEAEGTPLLVARTKVWLARVLTVAGDMAASRRLYDEGEAICRQSNDLIGLATAVGMRGTLFHELRDLNAQAADFGEAVRISRQVGNPLALARHLTNYGTVHRQRNELEEALAVYDEAEKIFQDSGNLGDAGSVAANRGIILYEKGDPAAARACFLRALEAYRFVGNRQQITLTLGNLAALSGDQGHLDQALAYATDAVEIARTLGSPHASMSALSTRSSLLGELKRHAEALAEAEEGLAIARSFKLTRDLPGLASCAAAALVSLGRGEEARNLVVEVLPFADRPEEDAFDRFLLQAHLARAEESLGRRDEARQAARVALAQANSLSAFNRRRLGVEKKIEEEVRRLSD
ncbi:MAG: tetratricopeptide repeat protein [Planctomycetota bacterium]